MNVFDLFPGDNKLADNIAKAVKEDSWHAGDNAWSSEHDQWTKESADAIPALTGVSENSEELQLGDEVLVTYPNQFQGKRGEITGFGRNKAFVIVEINGKEYSMHSSDVERLGGSEDWDDEDEDYGAFGDDERDELDEDDEYDGVYNPKAIQVGRKMAEFYGFTDPDDIQFIIEIIDNHIQRAQTAGTPLNAQEIKKDVANAVRQAFRGLGSYPSMRKKFQYDDELEEELNEYKGAHDKITFEVDSENAYNHIMHKYGNVIDWDGDYMTVPARYWPAVQELAFAAGGDVQEIELSEGAEFGAYYYEQLAQKVFDERPHFSTKGRANELVDYAYRFAVQDLGKSRARYEFNYDEDFISDFVSAYGELQRGEQGVAEGALNEGLDTDQLAGMIAARLERLDPTVFSSYGVEYVLDAVRDVAEFYAMSDFEELGTSDLGAMARSVVKQLKQREAHMNKGA